MDNHDNIDKKKEATIPSHTSLVEMGIRQRDARIADLEFDLEQAKVVLQYAAMYIEVRLGDDYNEEDARPLHRMIERLS